MFWLDTRKVVFEYFSFSFVKYTVFFDNSHLDYWFHHFSMFGKSVCGLPPHPHPTLGLSMRILQVPTPGATEPDRVPADIEDSLRTPGATPPDREPEEVFALIMCLD